MAAFQHQATELLQRSDKEGLEKLKPLVYDEPSLRAPAANLWTFASGLLETGGAVGGDGGDIGHMDT